MWTTVHEADIESDLSAFHRIDDPMTLDGPRYFLLACRLAAYMGVIAVRVQAETEAQNNDGSGAPTAAHAPSRESRETRVPDDVALAMLSADGWVEHHTEGEGE